jgi:hypothetical protein
MPDDERPAKSADQGKEIEKGVSEPVGTKLEEDMQRIRPPDRSRPSGVNYHGQVNSGPR